MEFTFTDISISGEQSGSIHGISGTVRTGEILAICGHSVTTNSCLLSTIAGRVAASSGEIELKRNGNQGTCLDWFERVSYVDRRDLFLPTLSINETLQYAAELRKRHGVSRKKLKQIVEEVSQLTGLRDVGSSQVLRALPRHKRMLSIGCELVGQNEVLIVDEPTAGLPFTDALEVMKSLSTVAKTNHIALIISTSSPSSSWLGLCDKVMFLSSDQVVYYGSPQSLSEFLLTAGCPCPQLMSPLDYMMVVLSETNSRNNVVKDKITQLSNAIQDSSETNDIWLKRGVSSSKATTVVEAYKAANGNDINGLNSGKTRADVYNKVTINGLNTDEITLSVEAESLLDHPMASAKSSDRYRTPMEARTCQTSFLHQLCILTIRNFHNARRRILFPVSLIQNLYILILCILVWWRPDRAEKNVADRMGLFFFTTVQWAFFALLDAILTFPKEFQVYQMEKERKLYHVSALCLAKSLSELPLSLIQPFVYLTVIYWVANLSSFSAFLWSLVVLALDVYAAQSIGLFVGVALQPPWTISVVSLGLLSMMLWGGAFNTLPKFLSWGPYASFFTYGLRAFIMAEFQNGAPIKCAESSLIPICNTVDVSTNTTVTHYPSESVLMLMGLTLPFYFYLCVLGAIIVVFRILWCILVKLK